jgi:DNA-binding NarL/FixJ family response regulator
MSKSFALNVAPGACSAAEPRVARVDSMLRDRSRDSAQPATAIVVEKRPLIRDLLLRSLERTSGFDVIAVATVDECVEIAATRDAKVVLLSVIGTPESEENQQTLQRAAHGLKGTPIAVLSDSDDLNQVMSVMQTGTRGYISTDMSLDVAIEALWLVRAGGQFLPASCVFGMNRGNGVQPAKPIQSRLEGMFTPRQAAVIEALCQGKANKIIAYELKMRESTVKVHVRNIMKKLKAKNRTEVAYITNQLVVGNSH